MQYVYSAKRSWYDFEDAPGGYWEVEVPGFSYVMGAGATVAEAAREAATALQLTIAELVDGGRTLPEPVDSADVDVVLCVEVDSRFIETSKCLTVAQAAEELGVTPGRVRQLISAGRLEGRVFDGVRMVTIASVNARKADPPAPHRPRREPATEPALVMA